MGVLKASLLVKIEQVVRIIAYVHLFLFLSILLFLDTYLQLLQKKIDQLSGNFFSNTFKRGTFIQYYIQYWAKAWIQIFGWDTVVEYNFEVPKHAKDNTIVMFTHGCNMDPFLIQATYPLFCHFIAKKSLFKIPIFGKCMAAAGQIPIDRENLQNAIQTLQDTADIAIKGNKTVAISPEGKRRRSPSVGREQLLPFKKGPFHLSKAIGVDVVPCVIHGGARLWRPGTLIPLPGTFIVKYLERIPAEKIKDWTLEEVQAEVKKRIDAELDLIPDEVIANTQNKPYALFLITLFGMFCYYSFLYRIFFGQAFYLKNSNLYNI